MGATAPPSALIDSYLHGHDAFTVSMRRWERWAARGKKYMCRIQFERKSMGLFSHCQNHHHLLLLLPPSVLPFTHIPLTSPSSPEPTHFMAKQVR